VGAQSWDDTLATEAKDWTTKCEYEHGPLVDGKMKKGRGQNLYTSNAKQLDITKATMLWYNEKDHYEFSTLKCNKEPCGHYTQVPHCAYIQYIA